MALTNAERARAYRDRQKQGAAPAHYRRPADRRTRPQRWRDAVQTLIDLLDDYAAWRDNLPQSLAEGVVAERLDGLAELRELVDQLEAAELPKGFGRD